MNKEFLDSKYDLRRFVQPLGYGVSICCSACESEITDDKGTAVNNQLCYHAVGRVSDDEGYEWRSFCRTCWDEIQSLTDEEIYNRYEPASFE